MTRYIAVVYHLYSENEYTREGRNGRIYTGILGWRWYPMLGSQQIGDPIGYKTRKEAIAAGKRETMAIAK